MEIWAPMPSVIFGSLAVITGSFMFFLPETKATKLPDTLQEAIDIGR